MANKSRLARLGIGSMMLVATAAPSAAQHIGAAPTGVAGSAVQECAACHATHEPGQGVAGLRVGDGGLRVSASVTPGLGDASLTCLRCHSTVRRREAVAVDPASPLATAEGRYLGLDLTDDHPLGEIANRQFVPNQRVRALRWGRSAGRNLRALRPGRWTETIDCTTCHDPHSRTGPTPSPEEEAMLCGGCHDVATYALGLHSTPACSDCHALHGARGDALLPEHDESRVCESCHGRGATLSPTTRDRDTPRLRLLVSPKGHVISPGGNCIDCHPAH